MEAGAGTRVVKGWGPRADNLRLTQLLAQELAAAEDPPVLVPGVAYPVWSPYDAFAAADTLLDVLRDSKGAATVDARATT